MSRLGREPIVHFLIGGLLLFGLHRIAVGPEGAGTRERIVVSESRVESIVELFERTRLRSPTSEELEALIRDYVDEEILYREALALGLDRDDLVVRRRMRQKMEFLHSDLVEAEPPNDRALADFLAAHPDRFRTPARVDFAQVFVGPDDDPEARARAWLAELRDGAPVEDLPGVPSLLPATMRRASEAEVSSSFGDAFAGEVFTLPAGEWQTAASTFGLHLVLVENRVGGRLPELDEIRGVVARELVAEERAAANRRFLDALRERYEVEIRRPGREDGVGMAQR